MLAYTELNFVYNVGAMDTDLLQVRCGIRLISELCKQIVLCVADLICPSTCLETLVFVGL
jgi:hypothetical protein